MLSINLEGEESHDKKLQNITRWKGCRKAQSILPTLSKKKKKKSIKTEIDYRIIDNKIYSFGLWLKKTWHFNNMNYKFVINQLMHDLRADQTFIIVYIQRNKISVI